ncbi:SAP7 [Candida oxycetoniae]|uniref:candidapepsin n=1 Tax=Candida oxycetoniae TaxID=497107 RepID=A0AAI9T0J3_9ASCO|nr:SAP7 [Candida oxycetoniae]KAI3406379.2 SAP7 [Candida oxycetoniae]
MQIQILVLLLSSTVFAYIGDGFISVPVNKVKSSSGLVHFPNRLPIFKKDIVDKQVGKIFTPFFGNSGFELNLSLEKGKISQSLHSFGDNTGCGESSGFGIKTKSAKFSASFNLRREEPVSNDTSSSSSNGQGTGAFFLDAHNEQILYYTTLSIGNPGQELSVMIDTGSSDLWVVGTQNPNCDFNGGSSECSKYGSFDKLKSSTFTPKDDVFELNYFDGSIAEGLYCYDDIEFVKDFALTNATFAVVENTTSNMGVFGVGYPEIEATPNKYTNTLFLMKEQNLIARAAFSLYLDEANAEQGYVLFGGVDYAKFSGELVAIDIVQDDGKYTYLQIPLSHVAASLNNYTDAYSTPSVDGTNVPKVGAAIYNGTDSFNGGIDLGNQAVLLDSGTTYSYLPQQQVESILGLFGNVTYNDDLKAYNVPCWIGNPSNYFQFNFNQEKDINVPISEFVIEVGVNSAGVPQCVFGILPGSMSILGDNVMRSVYAIFDLDANVISIAQAAYNNEHRVVTLE